MEQDKIHEAALEGAKIHPTERDRQTTYLEFIRGAEWQRNESVKQYYVFTENDMIDYADYCWNFSNNNRYKLPLKPSEWLKQLKY